MTQFKIIKIISKGKIAENKGSKVKFWKDIEGQRALIKLNGYYEDPNTKIIDWSKEIRSWNVSEKLFSEIANYLGFNCVKTDFIIDEKGRFGIASYDYGKNGFLEISGDDLYTKAVIKLPEKNKNRGIDANYHYEDILKILYFYGKDYSLIIDFNKIMIMDALMGEGDRHYENWSVGSCENNYMLFPMYDNSCCLLHSFREKEVLINQINKYSLEHYSNRSLSKIKINKRKIKHFDFIKFLLENLPSIPRKELIIDIQKLSRLTNEYICNLVNKIPDCLCTNEHKFLIIEYIKHRRDYLLSLIGGD